MKTSAQTLLGIILVCAVLMVYAPAARNHFVHYDDYGYVVENPHAQEGFTPAAFRWAFTTVDGGLWAPLTRLSHVLDYRMFGTRPAGHHVHNVLLHTLNTLFLYIFLVRATGRVRASALAAALFALHPMHVESVAWVASRKDVLSAAFMMLTLLAYDLWAREHRGYGLAAAILGTLLALLCKPVMVTLPAVLLLLDAWPYRRVDLNAPWPAQAPRMKALLLEKAPMLAPAALVCLITAYAEHGAIVPLRQSGISIRVVNAITSYMFYLWKCLVPYPLYVPYSMNPYLLTWFSAAVCLLILAAITFAFWQFRQRIPWGLTGWAWFLITLVPMIGLVQFGHHAQADRFTYIPFIGLFVIGAWAWEALYEKRPGWQRPLIGAAVAILAAQSVLAMVQIQHWKDTSTLFAHTLERDVNNAVALGHLAQGHLDRNQPDEAVTLLERAAQIDGENLALLNNLAVTYLMLERFADAERVLEIVVNKEPNDPETWANLAVTRYYLKDYAEARAALDQALRLAPNFDKARTLEKLLNQGQAN